MIRAATTLRSGFQRKLVARSNCSSGVHVSSLGWNDRADYPVNGAIPNGGYQRRFLSSDTPKDGSFDETMDKLFISAQKEASGEGDAWFIDEAAQAAWEPKWWNLADQAVNGVHFVQDMTGLHYAGSIFATTCLIRLVILPLAIRGQRAASRMAHVQPELLVIKKRYEALGTPTQAEQKAFAEQMKALFARYDVKPLASLAAPLVQAPLFIGMFFGMKKMPELYPTEFSTGGLLWFTDLTIPDPTYVLPLICGISFLATIETGKDMMIDSNPTSGPMMVNAFRAMAFVAVPVMTTFPAAMLCYWVPNNCITLVQSVVLRHPTVRNSLGIWDRPKPIPGMQSDVGFQETMQNLVKQVQGEPTTEAAKIKKHNDEIESKRRVAQVSKATRARRREGSQ
jgi:YidC/Oxa1 family membrane protein insertase